MKRVLPLALLTAAFGCGHVQYEVYSNPASTKLAQARELGAEELAPYEYYSAKEYYEKAQSEAAQADYGDASDLAEQSELFSEKAIRLARAARRGAGR